jgi:glycolate oxidase iron-sulfur subunit
MSRPIKEYQEETQRCIRCGLCQTVCPVYAVTHEEQSVARGKVRLARELLAGNVEVTPRMKEIMSMCLSCKACVVNCPSTVETDKVVLATRAFATEKDGLPLPMNFVLRNFLPNPSFQALAARLGHLYQSTGVQKMLRKSGLIKAVSEDMATKEGIMPEFSGQTFRSMLAGIPRKKAGKYRVAYFLSCVTNMINPDLGKAMIRTLEQHDCEVLIPTDVQCCGMAHLGYGDVETAKKLAANNMKWLLETGADFIVTDCATCGVTLKDYKELLPGAEEFSAKVFDISEFLVDKVGLQVGPKPVDGVVTYHDSCHLNRGQNVNSAPRKLLKAIPGITFKEMPEADRCCGGAGTFNMRHYDVSMKILDRKIANVKSVSPTMVAVGCPGCRIQIEYGLERNGIDIPVAHPVELLDRTYE